MRKAILFITNMITRNTHMLRFTLRLQREKSVSVSTITLCILYNNEKHRQKSESISIN